MHHLSKIKPAISLVTLFLLATVNFAFAKTITYEKVPIQRAQVELTEEQLLDVGILIFDPNIPEEERELIFPEIRKSRSKIHSLSSQDNIRGHRLLGRCLGFA